VLLSIAAVDEGILSLTRFKTPKPEDHYFGQRQLGLDVRDLYGQLILPAKGQRGRIRTGGDAAMENATGSQVRTVKTVALINRIVSLDANGRGQLALDLPDFNGRLRLMAVAYGQAGVGSGEAGLVVRDPVVTDLILPRFLAPGDRAEASLVLHNVTTQAQSVTPALSALSGLGLTGVPGPVALKPGERRVVPIALNATTASVNRIDLSAALAGRSIARQWDIGVRIAQPIVSERRLTVLKPGQSMKLTAESLSGFTAGSTRQSLRITTRPGFDVPALLDALYQYPYGCTEQTLSATLPLIVYADVAKAWDRKVDANELRRRVEQGVLRALARQTGDGGLALWTSTDDSDGWISAYAFDMLTRARSGGYYVPPAAYDSLRRYLQGYATRDYDVVPEAQAYALYALARTGNVRASDVRYAATERLKEMRTRLAVAQLAAAANAVGERDLATRLFALAPQRQRPGGLYQDYGSTTRDAAANIALLAEAGRLVPAATLAESLEARYARERLEWLSTQEQAWLLLATASLEAGAKPMQLQVGSATLGGLKGSFSKVVAPAELRSGLAVTNRGDSPVRVIETVRGAPVKPMAAAQNGYSITRRYFTLNGAPADLTRVQQNDRLIVVIMGRALDASARRSLIVDLLPAGFEIENAAIGGQEGEASRLGFALSTPQFADARDDRYVAAIDPNAWADTFTLAYTVRAVTPGRFIVPGVMVEDMYQPRFNARGPAGTLVVAARR
jgi:alpha-2-macroglobulin